MGAHYALVMDDSVTAGKTREQKQTRKQKPGHAQSTNKKNNNANSTDAKNTLSIVDKKQQAMARRDEAMASAKNYANRSRSDGTWRAYENDWRQFCHWCESVDLPALPADPETVAGFISIQADEGRAISTIRRRLAAIRLMHIASDHPSPHDTLQVNEVLRGIANAQRNRPIKQAKPAGDEMIKRMVDAMDLTTLAGLRNRALVLLGFDAALRRSELVAIDRAHITQEKNGLVINIPYSKTDQAGTGQQVGILTRPDSPYCPVTALDSWLVTADIKRGAIFRRIYKGDRLSDARLTDRSVSNILKQCASTTGVSTEERDLYSGHSLRRGFITSAVAAGTDITAIMRQTRHKRADSVIGYVHSNDLIKSHPGKRLLKGKL